MNEHLIQHFFFLEIKLASIQEELSRIIPLVAKEIEDSGGEIVHNGYSLRTEKHRQFRFSDEVQVLEKILNDKKNAEISSGASTVQTEQLNVTMKPTINEDDDDLSTLDRIRLEYPRAYQSWTHDEELTLKRLFDEGKSIKEIAVELERKPGGIESRLVKLGLIKR